MGTGLKGGANKADEKEIFSDRQDFLKEISLKNILSFGAETLPLALRSLNILIGPNGSGKSNLIDCIGLLHQAPDKIVEAFRSEGATLEWIYDQDESQQASIEILARGVLVADNNVRHRLAFRSVNNRLEIVDELIDNESPRAGNTRPYLYYSYANGHPVINTKEKGERKLVRAAINPEESILSQRKDPDEFPVLSVLAERYTQIGIYRDWSFGRRSIVRGWQDTSGVIDRLLPNGSNLALILNSFQSLPKVKKRIRELLGELYDGITDFGVQTIGTRSQLFLEEGDHIISAPRLSDGTLRFLYFLAILLHPDPPVLICLEEPEIGLHPDAIVTIGKLIKECSSRTQIILTTHSPLLLDSMNCEPEDVIVCEKNDCVTRLSRLDSSILNIWLDKYSLGELWQRNQIGGNRW